DRLAALRDLERDLEAQLAEVAAARDRLSAERARVEALHAEVDAAYASQSAALAEERSRAEALAREVDTLSGLVAALRRAAAEAPQVTIEIVAVDEPSPAQPPSPAGPARASFVPPVRG